VREGDGSWQDKLRSYLLTNGVSRAAIDNAHVDPETFVEETLARLWESGIDVVHAMLTQSGDGLRARALPESSASTSSSANATLMPVEKRLPKNNTEVLEALLAKFPDSPTVCLRRRNVLDAYVSLYRAEHGDAPWQIVAEPPPAPAAGTPGVAAGGVRNAGGTSTGVWGLGEDGNSKRKSGDVFDDAKTAPTFTDGADGRASAEAFGAFGDVPGDDALFRDDAVGVQTRLHSSRSSGTSENPERTETPRRVRFDPAVFAWLDYFETEWLDEVESLTKSAGDGLGCESLVYEDALADEARQRKTLEWLNARFSLGLNVEALPLQKLRRVNKNPATLQDFENPDALDKRARSFLRTPEFGKEDAAVETVDDYEPR
jgi:hypothetical protein